MTTKQKTCHERVREAYENRIDALKLMTWAEQQRPGALEELREVLTTHNLTPDTRDDQLTDDELDLVTWAANEIPCETWELDPEYLYEESFSEYGLSFDYVEPGTFNDQGRGYWRYQISWGGPSDEFRFYLDDDKQITMIEYWFLDWFDGASINVNFNPEYDFLRDLFQGWIHWDY